MRLLDLFCGAGGAAMGYHRAGFEVVGVDIKPQPHFPFEFVQADALEYVAEHWYKYDVIHASPPCQIHSAMTKGRWQHRLDGHVNLIPPTRKLLKSFGGVYVIENVPGAKYELDNPLMLCGTMFGLQTKHGSQIIRHRYFETWPPIWFPPQPCQHNRQFSAVGVYGGGQNPTRKRIPKTIGVYGHAGGSSERDALIGFSTDDRRDAMGIDWMTGSELSQAIPPAYTEFIGNQLIVEMRGEL